MVRMRPVACHFLRLMCNITILLALGSTRTVTNISILACRVLHMSFHGFPQALLVLKLPYLKKDQPVPFRMEVRQKNVDKCNYYPSMKVGAI